MTQRHIAAEYQIAGTNRNPVVIISERALIGVNHIDVEIAGRSIVSVIEGKRVDVATPADFSRRVNLLTQTIAEIRVCRQIGVCHIALSDLHEGFQCGGEALIRAPVTHGVAAVGTHLHGIARFRCEASKCVGARGGINGVSHVAVKAYLPSGGGAVLGPAQLRTVAGDVGNGEIGGLLAGISRLKAQLDLVLIIRNIARVRVWGGWVEARVVVNNVHGLERCLKSTEMPGTRPSSRIVIYHNQEIVGAGLVERIS